MAVVYPAVVLEIADNAAHVVDRLLEGARNGDVFDAAGRVGSDYAEETHTALLVIGVVKPVDRVSAPVEAAAEGGIGRIVRVEAYGRPHVRRGVEHIPVLPALGIVHPDIVRQREILAVIRVSVRNCRREQRELARVVYQEGILLRAAAAAVGKRRAAVPYLARSGDGARIDEGFFRFFPARYPVGRGGCVHIRVVIELGGHQPAVGPRAVAQARDDYAVGKASRLHGKGLAVLVKAADPADVTYLVEPSRPGEHRLAHHPGAVDILYLALGGAPVGVVHHGVYVGGNALLIRHEGVHQPLAVGRVGGAAPVRRIVVELTAEHIFRVIIVIEGIERGLVRGHAHRAVYVFPGRRAAALRRKIQVRVGGDRSRIDALERPTDEFRHAVRALRRAFRGA